MDKRRIPEDDLNQMITTKEALMKLIYDKMNEISHHPGMHNYLRDWRKEIEHEVGELRLAKAVWYGDPEIENKFIAKLGV